MKRKRPVLLQLLYAMAMLLTACNGLYAQNLGFSEPIHYLPGVRTDKALDITNFKKGFFVTWKGTGATAPVYVAYLGKQYDTSFKQQAVTIAEGKSAYAPVLRVFGNRMYLFWIDMDGTVKYIINNTDTSFNTGNVYSFTLNNAPVVSAGITAAKVGGKLVIATHGSGDQLLLAITEPGADGVLPATQAVPLPQQGTEYPFVVALGDTALRLTYKGKKQDLFYADYNLQHNSFSPQQSLAGAASEVAPAVYRVFTANRLFYIWRGAKKDDRLYYSTDTIQMQPRAGVALPPLFTTQNPVSICTVDDKKFILSFVGNDGSLYLSYFTNYQTASWMGDLLLPRNEHLTLKDVVLPGSHDAGMSVLSGTGGMQASSVNECNTLTQSQNIARQLEAGIRMFDLRVGSFKNDLYVKHCSADCMADAMGGGYGEKLGTVLDAVHNFMQQHNREIVLLTFSHFCERETSAQQLAAYIAGKLGSSLLYKSGSKKLDALTLQELAGKVLVSFEGKYYPAQGIDSCAIQTASGAFINFRRAYAATNDIKKLLQCEEQFFTELKDGTAANDLVRLDWQLTQSSEEAAMVCNDFQNEKTSPLVNGAMLLTNILKKNQSITDLSLKGNKYLPSQLNQWISSGIVNRRNKPNIIYVDVAGAWITDYCIQLNQLELYR
ncbi:phosphatidylinositol-specific phospholipase C domain-containing protein [Deminuibacter soli]|nr:phosphatidylinositol-specific phospholipase C domain-containing protein [Deminuibacter soli]